MTTQIYVVAQSGRQIELVYGSFDSVKVGDMFERETRFHGKNPWWVRSIPGPEMQNYLVHLCATIGHERFELLKSMFHFEVD